MATRVWIGTDSGNEGDWATDANWSGASVPVDLDDVVFENSSQDLTSGFNQIAIELTSLRIDKSYTGIFGTTTTPAYLIIGASTVDIGYHYGPGTPAGSGQILLNLEDTTDGVTPSTIIVHDTGQPTSATLPACRILHNEANTTIEVRKGSVGIASEVGESSTVGSVNVRYVSQKTTDANVVIGNPDTAAGITLTTLEQIAGKVTLFPTATVTTVTVLDGTLLSDGADIITTMNVKGGTVTSNSTGNITNLNVTGGHVDFTKSDAARTVATPLLDYPGRMSFDTDVITLTNEIKPANGGPVTYSATRV